MNKYTENIIFRAKKFVINNKVEFALLVFILILALFLRVWKIDQYLPFLGDEGRDVRVVRRFLTSFDLMFIGPRTSIGDMYLGPFYYYLISPFLLLWNYSPVGPAVCVSLFSVATVYLIWFTVREWFGKYGAIAASLLFAISPIIIINARHSWNPNIMPFLALLSIYSIWKVWVKLDFKWLLVAGFTIGAIIQSHYLGLLLLPTLGIVWLLTLYQLVKSKTKTIKSFINYSLGAFTIFLLFQLPLVLFDWKHNWHNALSLKEFFFNRQTTVSVKPWNAIPSLLPLWKDQIITRLMSINNGFLGGLLTTVLTASIGFFGFYYSKTKNKEKSKIAIIIALWGVIGLVGIGLLKQAVYDHYFGFLFPLPFILFGLLFQELYSRKSKVAAIIILVVLVYLSIKESPIGYPAQNQLKRVQEIDTSIIADSNGKPFNFALIAKQNYEEGYLYYFELWKAQVREIDPQNIPNTLTNQLYIVCEDPICEPINNAKAEVANFGWAKLDKQWEISGTKVYKIVHPQ